MSGDDEALPETALLDGSMRTTSLSSESSKNSPKNHAVKKQMLKVHVWERSIKDDEPTLTGRHFGELKKAKHLKGLAGDNSKKIILF